MDLVEHLKSPQFRDAQGRPTNRNRVNRMFWLTAPGTPRWVGYLFYLAVIGIGLVALIAWGHFLIAGFMMALGILGSVEVWRGKPWWSRNRIDYPPTDEEGEPSKGSQGGRTQPPPLAPPPPHWQ